jgi:CubicO group peptidase (beta-lactamase class C family)
VIPDPRRALFDLLEGAVRDAAFPGAVALVWRDGATLYHEAHGHFATREGLPEAFRGVARDSVYDLASLTKVLATTTLAAVAVSEGLLALDSPVPAPWSQACPGAALRHLLAHWACPPTASTSPTSARPAAAPTPPTACSAACATPRPSTRSPPARSTATSAL